MAIARAGAPAPRPEPSPGGARQPGHNVAHLGDFEFQNGEVVEDFKISYVTHGRMNAAKDNVVLVFHCFTQDHHAFDFLIGPGKALDPQKYFIVAPDFIANGHLRYEVTTGPTNSSLNMAFPTVTVPDSVAADYRLLTEVLGIKRVRAAMGASIGAMKAYQIAVSHPDFVAGIIPIMGSPKTNSQMRSVLRNAMRVITLDPGWKGGNYQTNPIAGATAALMTLSPWWYTNQWYTSELANGVAYKRWEKKWRYVWSIETPQDARDLYYQMRLWADFDLAAGSGFAGDTRAALSSIRAKTLLIAVKDDLMVRREEMILARDSIPGATYVELDSRYGHLACCNHDPEATSQMDAVIGKFLAELE